MPTDSFYRYDDFEAFSLPAKRLSRPWEISIPEELVSHDVNESEWFVIAKSRTCESDTPSSGLTLSMI